MSFFLGGEPMVGVFPIYGYLWFIRHKLLEVPSETLHPTQAFPNVQEDFKRQQVEDLPGHLARDGCVSEQHGGFRSIRNYVPLNRRCWL
jgi:hypothetical protein